MLQTVADVLTSEVVATRPETSFREAVRLIEQHRVHALPVVDDDGRPVGIVTECDLLLKEELLPEPHADDLFGLRRRRDRARASARTVGEAMTSPVVTTSSDASLQSAARQLHKRHVGRLVVVDDDGRMIGLVTRSDLLRVFLRSDDDLAQDVVDALRECGVRPGEVTPVVRDGVVVLRGEVDLTSRAELLVRRVRGIAGLVAVEDEVACRSDDLHFAAFGF